MDRDPVLERAFRTRLTIKQIAEAAGISVAAVCQWRRVPEARLGVVAKITGIPQYKLRPDLVSRPRKRLRVVAK